MNNGSKPVYPVFDSQGYVVTNTEFLKGHNSLTKREYFAAAAMQGYMANYHTPHQAPNHIAGYAVQCADALLEALEKES